MQEKSTRDAKCGCLLMERDKKVELRKKSPQMLRTAVQWQECCRLWIRFRQSAKSDLYRKSVQNAGAASEWTILMPFMDTVLGTRVNVIKKYARKNVKK